MNRLIVFRVDASLQIGVGHVMRCLTLADALAEQGATCHFICRAHKGNLIEFIRGKGFKVHLLPISMVQRAEANSFGSELAHSQWLGATQAEDAEACTFILGGLSPDWLVVDHYALDFRWEGVLAPLCQGIMVIDDLADRVHKCDLLMDQNFGREIQEYRALTPDDCSVLCGSKYALLRAEFAKLRAYSLKRRAKPVMRELLISMGGVDKDNATGKILELLQASPLPSGCRITVVMGGNAPWVDEVRFQANMLPWQTRILIDVNNMAQLMAHSDLAIGAPGSTSWERCCLGLPSILIPLADNQRFILSKLKQAGAVDAVDMSNYSFELEFNRLISEYIKPKKLSQTSKISAVLCDGLGSKRLVKKLYE